MTYEETETAVVSALEAKQEIEKHGHDANEFFADYGCHDTYIAFHIMAWLGY